MRRFALFGWALSACATSLGPASTPEPPAGTEARGGASPVDTPPLPVARDTADVVDTVPAAVPPAPEPFREALPDIAVRRQGSATRYANLSPSACVARLRAEALPFRRIAKADGIAAPVRFDGTRLGEVTFRVPPERTPFGLLDCRLALALAELTPVLRAHQVAAVRIDNFYRPRAKLPQGHGKKSQHAYGLAADVVSFTLDDGRVLDVERDFHGRLGEPVCGPGAFLEPLDDAATRLRNLVCELGRGGYFHHMLTPNHDAAHRNHLHLDIKRDNQWFSVE